MVLEFPNDPACATLDRQYMLGSSILVAPVLNDEGIAQYYLPEGTWTHLVTGQTRAGGCWYEEKYGFTEAPIFVRAGTALTTGPREDRPDYEYPRDVSLTIYQLADGAATAATLVDERGQTYTASVKRQGTDVRVTWDRALPAGWSVQVAGQAKQSVAAGRTEHAFRLS
jgi:alpha-D-xyloside xylohydrolase